jgi:hypothetical protein
MIMSKNLRGAPINYSNPYPNVLWANTAPPIAGLPQYTTEQAVTLLMTGVSRTGQPLRKPMPQFRMNEKDARDVVAFLKSVK